MIGFQRLINIMSKVALVSNIFFRCITNGCRSVAAASFSTTSTAVNTCSLSQQQQRSMSRGSSAITFLPLLPSRINGLGHQNKPSTSRHDRRDSFTTTKTNLASQSQQQQTQQTLSIDDEGGYYEAEQVIKKSRFIGIAKHCSNWGAAQEFIQNVRQEHPKSRHVCFGFVCGTNPVTERCSDDGEPTGEWI